MRRRARLLRVERSGREPLRLESRRKPHPGDFKLRPAPAEERERQVEREQLLLILQGHRASRRDGRQLVADKKEGHGRKAMRA